MTVIAVACCPHPPALVPALANGAAHELDAVRAASRAAVATMLATTTDEVYVLGTGARTQTHDGTARGSFARYGLSLEVGAGSVSPTLPLALTVGAWLLADAEYHGPATYQELAGDIGDGDADAVAAAITARAGRVALLVMGDGSACRTAAAPGGLDPRAESFDSAIATALAAADATGLAEVDRVRARQLLVAGAVPWAVLGRVASRGIWSGDLIAHEAPWGVGYLVARWQHTGVS